MLYRNINIEVGHYTPGDIVELVTGGPDLVVLETSEDGEYIGVAWFVDDVLQTAALPVAAVSDVDLYDGDTP